MQTAEYITHLSAATGGTYGAQYIYNYMFYKQTAPTERKAISAPRSGRLFVE